MGIGRYRRRGRGRTVGPGHLNCQINITDVKSILTIVLLFDNEGLSSGVSASEEDDDLSGLDKLDHGRYFEPT